MTGLSSPAILWYLLSYSMCKPHEPVADVMHSDTKLTDLVVPMYTNIQRNSLIAICVVGIHNKIKIDKVCIYIFNFKL